MDITDEPEFTVGVEDLRNKQTWRHAVAEALGTFILVFIGIGAAASPEATLLNIAIAFGFIVAVLVHILGDVGGCHLNPAVTLGVFILGKISIIKSLVYVVAQLFGSSLAMLALAFALPAAFRDTHTGESKVTGITQVQGMVIEGVITAILVLLLGSVLRSKKSADNVAVPIYFGLAVCALVLMAGGFSGANLNPARSFGPAVVFNAWSQQWLYWVGPLSGATIAALISRVLF